MTLLRINRHSTTAENVVEPVERWANGRYIPRLLLDEQGRRMVVVDPREVERRLKARKVEE